MKIEKEHVDFEWEHDDMKDLWFVVEGLVRTGGFVTKDGARKYFADKLDIQLQDAISHS